MVRLHLDQEAVDALETLRAVGVVDHEDWKSLGELDAAVEVTMEERPVKEPRRHRVADQQADRIGTCDLPAAERVGGRIEDAYRRHRLARLDSRSGLVLLWQLELWKGHQGLDTPLRQFDRQDIVGEATMSLIGETCRQRALAGATVAKEEHRATLDGDGAGVWAPNAAGSEAENEPRTEDDLLDERAGQS